MPIRPAGGEHKPGSVVANAKDAKTGVPVGNETEVTAKTKTRYSFSWD
jgi:hypothetical protein